VKQFRIEPKHLTLLQCMYVSWWGAEFGAPCIDPKRPYGNGDVIKDMIEILDVDAEEDEDGLFPRGIELEMAALHDDIKTVLQICLVSQKFEAGLFEMTREYNVRSWVKIA